MLEHRYTFLTIYVAPKNKKKALSACTITKLKKQTNKKKKTVSFFSSCINTYEGILRPLFLSDTHTHTQNISPECCSKILYQMTLQPP